MPPELVGWRRVHGDENHGDPDGSHQDHEAVESITQGAAAIIAHVAVDPTGGEDDMQGEDDTEGDPWQKEADDHGASKPFTARLIMAVAVARGSSRSMVNAASLFA